MYNYYPTTSVMWRCPTCTFQNNADTQHCEMCITLKPKQYEDLNEAIYAQQIHLQQLNILFVHQKEKQRNEKDDDHEKFIVININKFSVRTHPLCNCGKELKKYRLKYAYDGKFSSISCNKCKLIIKGAEEMIYHCPDHEQNLCLKCGQQQLISLDDEKNYPYDNDDEDDDDEYPYIAKAAKSKQIRNPLVLLICVADYDGTKYKSLKGVKVDYYRYLNLFQQKYGFTVYPQPNARKNLTKNQSFFHWKAHQIKAFVNKYRNETFENEHDGIIVIIRGHGDGTSIIASDIKKSDDEKHDHEEAENKKVEISDLQMRVSSSAWNDNAVRIPRLFFIDTCRGSQDSSVPGYAQPQGPRASSKDFKLLKSWYGNPRGYLTFVDTKKGGVFSQCLIRAFEEYAGKLHKTIDDVADYAGDLIEKNHSGSNQIVRGDGDGKAHKYVLVPKYQ